MSGIFFESYIWTVFMSFVFLSTHKNVDSFISISFNINLF